MTDDNAWRELSAPSNEAWDQQAVPWDTRMAEDGNDFHLMLVRPATESLLSINPGERVLDVACGNGIFSHRLARLGAHVTAIDVSPTLIERARARGDSEDDIDYRLIDATSESQLLALGESNFDAAMCNMALMDLADIGPLASSLRHLLKGKARCALSGLAQCIHIHEYPGRSV